MTAPAPALLQSKKPLWRRLLKWTLRAAILLLILGIAAYSLTYYWTSKTINTEIARIRAAGEPLTFAELDKLIPKVDRAHDAGPYYRAAQELAVGNYETDSANFNLLFGDDAIPQSLPATLRSWAQRGVDANTEALALLDRGSALPGCNADIQLEYGIAAAIRPQYGVLYNAAKLRTRSLALEGHPDQAVESLQSSLGLLRIFDRQPVLVDALIQFTILTRASRDISFLLNYAHLADGNLQKLGATLEQVQLVTPRQVFVAERVYALELYRGLLANGVEIAPPSPEEPLLPERQSFVSLGVGGHIMIAKTLHFQARYIDAATGDWPAILNSTQNVSDSATSILDKIMAPPLARVVVDQGKSLSIHRSTFVAIQIERYRRAHNNQLPDSLAQLPNAASLPKDPFTGTSLLYTKTEDGYCVFSAGRNNPKDNPEKIDRDKDPIGWSTRWGTHIRTTPSPK